MLLFCVVVVCGVVRVVVCVVRGGVCGSDDSKHAVSVQGHAYHATN